jgi:hypothetical protein
MQKHTTKTPQKLTAKTVFLVLRDKATHYVYTALMQHCTAKNIGHCETPDSYF